MYYNNHLSLRRECKKFPLSLKISPQVNVTSHHFFHFFHYSDFFEYLHFFEYLNFYNKKEVWLYNKTWVWGGGGGVFPLFPEMEFRLLCFSLFHRIVEIDLLDGEIFIIWGYLYMALYADYTFTDWWKYSTIIPQIVKINTVGFSHNILHHEPLPVCSSR